MKRLTNKSFKCEGTGCFYTKLVPAEDGELVRYRDYKKLLIALDIIQSGFEMRNGAPKMNGTFEREAHVMSRKRMMEVAREALDLDCPLEEL